MTRRIPLGVATPELRVVLACRDRPCVGTDAAVWSSDRGPGGPKTPEIRAAEAAREAAARAICTPCPVRCECVTHALAVETWLVWGGFDKQQHRERLMASPHCIAGASASLFDQEAS